MTSARGSSKEPALRAVSALSTEADRALLRTLILAGLRGRYAPPSHGTNEDLAVQDARCWLLSALGRVCDQDAESRQTARRHLTVGHEPDEWVRYWTLEGLVAGKAEDLAALAHEVIAAKDKPLVRYLALAIKAASGDAEAIGAIRSALGKREIPDTWATLRALRVVPVQDSSIVRELTDIVDKGDYSDLTFDAIVALGEIPADSQQAEAAASSLADYLVSYRWPMYDSMRVRALAGLGKLRVPRTAAVLSEELLDESPAVVAGAARAVELVLGGRVAVGRIIESAVESSRDDQVRLAGALRYMDRRTVLEVLESSMASGADGQQETAKILMSEVGGAEAFQRLRARGKAATEYMAIMREAEEKVTMLVESSTNEARQGFRIAMAMDVSVFVIGIVLIMASGLAVLFRGEALDGWVGIGLSGGVGVAGVLYSLFIANPRERVSVSVRDLMHVKIVFLGYLRQLHQADNAYMRRVLDDRDFPVSEVSAHLALVDNTMKSAIAELARDPNQRSSADDLARDASQRAVAAAAHLKNVAQRAAETAEHAKNTAEHAVETAEHANGANRRSDAHREPV